jgi:hypothetical protein
MQSFEIQSCKPSPFEVAVNRVVSQTPPKQLSDSTPLRRQRVFDFQDPLLSLCTHRNAHFRLLAPGQRRSRPPIDASETNPIQASISKISVADLPHYNTFAATRCRPGIELARTAPAAVTGPGLFTCDPPFDFRRFAHIFLRVLRSQLPCSHRGTGGDLTDSTCSLGMHFARLRLECNRDRDKAL